MHAIVALLIALVAVEKSNAAFKCTRRHNESSIGTTTAASNGSASVSPILDLQPLLSLENLCSNLCNNCSSGGANSTGQPGNVLGGVLGALSTAGPLGGVLGGIASVGPLGGVLGQGTGAAAGLGNVVGGLGNAVSGILPANQIDQLLASAGVTLNPLQGCIVPCLLNLDLLDACDVPVVLSRLSALCPSLDLHGLCADVCACCGESGQPLDLCVNLCLSNANGNGTGVTLPLIGTPPTGNLLPGVQLGVGGLNGVGDVVNGLGGGGR